MEHLTNDDITKGGLLAVFKRATWLPDAESVLYAKKVDRTVTVKSGDKSITAAKGDVILLGKNGIPRAINEQMISKTYHFVAEDKVAPNFGARLNTLKWYLGLNGCR